MRRRKHCQVHLRKTRQRERHRACERIPLAAMLLAGQRVPFKLTVHLHPLGTPVMCARAFAPVADAIALDADVESVADTNAHHPLRRALMDARSASPSTSDGVDAVRSLLEEAYSASPDWADTFELWKVTHGKTYGAPAEQVPQQSEAEEAAAVLAEARAFAQFRENVLTAHRAGAASASTSARTRRARRAAYVGPFRMRAEPRGATGAGRGEVLSRVQFILHRFIILLSLSPHLYVRSRPRGRSSRSRLRSSLLRPRRSGSGTLRNTPRPPPWR